MLVRFEGLISFTETLSLVSDSTWSNKLMATGFDAKVWLDILAFYARELFSQLTTETAPFVGMVLVGKVTLYLPGILIVPVVDYPFLT